MKKQSQPPELIIDQLTGELTPPGLNKCLAASSLLPDALPERRVIVDQALSILRALRARDAEGARALATEVLGY